MSEYEICGTEEKGNNGKHLEYKGTLEEVVRNQSQ